jgi:hypothetical protein
MQYAWRNTSCQFIVEELREKRWLGRHEERIG